MSHDRRGGVWVRVRPLFGVVGRELRALLLPSLAHLGEFVGGVRCAVEESASRTECEPFDRELLGGLALEFEGLLRVAGDRFVWCGNEQLAGGVLVRRLQAGGHAEYVAGPFFERFADDAIPADFAEVLGKCGSVLPGRLHPSRRNAAGERPHALWDRHSLEDRGRTFGKAFAGVFGADFDHGVSEAGRQGFSKRLHRAQVDLRRLAVLVRRDAKIALVGDHSLKRALSDELRIRGGERGSAGQSASRLRAEFNRCLAHSRADDLLGDRSADCILGGLDKGFLGGCFRCGLRAGESAPGEVEFAHERRHLRERVPDVRPSAVLRVRFGLRNPCRNGVDVRITALAGFDLASGTIHRFELHPLDGRTDERNAALEGVTTDGVERALLLASLVLGCHVLASVL